MAFRQAAPPPSRETEDLARDGTMLSLDYIHHNVASNL